MNGKFKEFLKSRTENLPKQNKDLTSPFPLLEKGGDV